MPNNNILKEFIKYFTIYFLGGHVLPLFVMTIVGFISWDFSWVEKLMLNIPWFWIRTWFVIGVFMGIYESTLGNLGRSYCL